ncbi:MAG: aldo/keto reductase [Myxococcota bacterium]
MEKRKMGRLGPPVPLIGQGTWRMEADDHPACIAAIRRGLDLGMTHIDTAELYGAGVVEERIVAPAIAGRRGEVYLVSKVLPTNASRRGTVEACERSLRRLGTDYLDLYLLHWPGDHPLEDTLAAFEELVAAGKIRAWGLSNFDVGELEQAQRIAGAGRIACDQVLYHLKERAIEHRVLPWCEENGVAVVAYSPFGAGDFPSSPVLEEVAKVHGASAHQVALAFLLRKKQVLVIPKASRLAHVEDNAKAAQLSLSAEELRRIDVAFPARRARGLPVI